MSDIPVLLSKYQRLILWGCTVKDDTIQAELFYLDSHLPAAIKISDRAEKEAYQVEIPEELQGLIFPQKGQQIRLRIL